jgi:hypothetical protein
VQSKERPLVASVVQRLGPSGLSGGRLPEYDRDGGPTACGKRWTQILASFERNIEGLLSKHQDCTEEIRLIHASLLTLGKLVNISPSVNGNGTSWIEITSRAEAERIVLCKHRPSQPCCGCMPPRMGSCETLSSRSQTKRRLLRNFASRGGASEIAKTKNPPSLRKQ